MSSVLQNALRPRRFIAPGTGGPGFSVGHPCIKIALQSELVQLLAQRFGMPLLHLREGEEDLARVHASREIRCVPVVIARFNFVGDRKLEYLLDGHRPPVQILSPAVRHVRRSCR